jgi:hypothetical protein
MDSSWLVEADKLARQIAEMTDVDFERTLLTEKLCEYQFESGNPDSASIKVLVSPFAIIVSAGRGTQFELDASQDGRAEALLQSKAIAAGRLKERVWPNRVRFELELEDGRVLKGGARFRLIPAPMGQGEDLIYAPYGAHRSDESGEPS